MLIPFLPSKSRTRSKHSVPVAERLQAKAEAARESGDLERAVEYYRAALDHAPLDRTLRHTMAEVLLEAAHNKPAARRSDVPSTAVLPEVEFDEETPPPAPRKPKEPSPSRRLKKRNPGMADMDEESEPEHTWKFGDTPSPAVRRPEKQPKSTARKPRKSARGRAPMFIMAALFTGIVLVVAGLAHGVISRAMESAALPEVPVESEVPSVLASMLSDAESLLSSGESEKALTLLEQASTTFADHNDLIDAAKVQALRVTGSRSLEKREYREAIKQFEEATRLDPLNKDNWIELARAFREQGRTRQSRDAKEGRELLVRSADAYERALVVQENDPAALVGLGQVYSFLNDRNSAVQYYRKVIDAAPESPEARIARQHLTQLTGQG